MKKLILYIIVFVLGLAIIALAVPIFFKDTIQQQLNRAIAQKVKAKVYYQDLGLSFFRSFPSLTLSLTNFGVVGKAPFAQDTLIQAKSLDMSIDLSSVLKSTPTIQYINLVSPKIFVKVLKNGQANYDILVKEEQPSTPSKASEQQMEVKIKGWQVQEGALQYINLQDNSLIELSAINHNGHGEIANELFDLETNTEITKANVYFQGKEYLNNRKITLQSLIGVNQARKSYTFQDTKLGINDFLLTLAGTIAQVNQDYRIELTFGAPENAFKNLISLIPSLYQNQFNTLEANGNIQFDGHVKGLYSATTYPAFNLNLQVNQGAFQYPNLPAGVKNVNLDLNINNGTAQLENTNINLKRFDLIFGKNPIKAKASIQGIKTAKVEAELQAKFDLQELSQLFPMDGLNMKGAFSVDLQSKGTYDSSTKQFPITKAALLLSNGYIKSSKFPEPIEQINLSAVLNNTDGALASTLLNINQANFVLENEPFVAKGIINDFNNYSWDIAAKGKVDLTKITKIYPLKGMAIKGIVDADIHTKGKMSDVTAKRYGNLPTSGRAQLSQFEYVSKEYPQGIKVNHAKMNFTPSTIQVVESNGYLGSSDFQATGSFFNYLGYALGNDKLKGNIQISSQNFLVNEWMSDQPKAKQPSEAKPANLSVVEVPQNLDITVNAQASQIVYDKMNMKSAKGILKIGNGMVKLQNTSFDALGGHFVTTGTYNPVDIAHPKFDFGLNLEKINLTEAYQNLNVVKALMPVAQYMLGEVSTQFKLDGELGQDMMPNMQTINGAGLIKLLKATINNNPLIEKLVENTKLTQLKDLQLSNLLMQIQINQGTLSIKPFTIKWNDYNLKVEGQHGITGSMNYKLGFDIPSGKAGETFSNVFTQWTGKSLQNTPRIKFDLGLGGTLKIPVVKFNGSSTAQSLKDAVATEAKTQIDAVKAQATEQLDKLKQEAEDKLKAEKDKLLQNAQDKLKTEQDNIQARAKTTADSLKKQAMERARKLLEEQKKGVLDGLFKKPKPVKKDSTR